MDKPKRHAPKGPLKNLMAGSDPMSGRCTAHSKQTKERCKQPAILGGNVCRYHGGAAPQVKQAALERLQALQDRAIDRLAALVDQDSFPSTAYAAARDILDRTMGKPKETADVNHSGELVIRHELE